MELTTLVVQPIGNTAVSSSFEKLEGIANYIDWKFGMEIHLTNCQLWGCVDGTKTDNKMSKRVLASIISGVKSHIYTEIRELKSGKDKGQDGNEPKKVCKWRKALYNSQDDSGIRIWTGNSLYSYLGKQSFTLVFIIISKEWKLLLSQST